MFGAITGDIVGSPFEFNRGKKTKDFTLFSLLSHYTDDSVMTVAVADACLKLDTDMTDDEIRKIFSDSMQHFGRKHPLAGYGSRFTGWLMSFNPRPYNSFGNGSAMRVSPVGFAYNDMDTVRRIARLSADVTHNHPEGIKGAESVACAIFMARKGSTKAEIKEFIISEFGYDLSRSCDEIRPGYRHVESCQETVPEAITAFLEGENFEDVIRTAVSLGGDCDTLTAIAGSMAEAFYGVPDSFKTECMKRLPADLKTVVEHFTAAYSL